MVTLAYFLAMALLAVLIAILDMMLFQYGFFEAMKSVYFSEVLTGRIFVILGIFLGFGFSVTTDIRLYLKKRKGIFHEET